MKSHNELDRLWSDPSRWNADGSYQGTGDPRVVVPKIGGWGWTLNVAHPAAKWVMLSIIVGILGFVIGIGAVIANRT